MVNVTRDQPTKIVGIFARSAAPTLVEQELDPVEVFKDSGWRVGAISG
jgi:hypothetical protein